MLRVTESILIFIQFAGFFIPTSPARGDSLFVTGFRFNTGISISFLNTINWQGNYYNNLILFSDSNLEFNLESDSVSQIYKFKLEIGFTHFNDSVWLKHADQVQARYFLKKKNGKWSQSASSIFNGQLLNSYEYSYNTQNSSLDKEKTGSFFSPSNFELGYGTGYSPFPKAIFNFSIATARFRRIPGSLAGFGRDEIRIAYSKGNGIYFDYGISAQYSISGELSHSIDLNSDGKVFVRGLDKNLIDSEISLNLALKIKWFLKIRLDFKMIYAPAIFKKPQFRNELMAGINYTIG